MIFNHEGFLQGQQNQVLLNAALQNFHRKYSLSTKTQASKIQMWKIFSKWCSEHPSNHQTMNWLVKIFEEAQKNPFIALFIALKYQSIKQDQQAEVSYRSAIIIIPQFKSPVKQLSNLLKSQHKISQLLNLLTNYCNSFPMDKEVLRLLCQIYQLAKQRKKAADIYERLIILEPMQSLFYFNFAENQLKCTHEPRLEKCGEYIQKGIALSRQYEYMFYSCKGIILCQNQRIEQGVSMLFRSINLNRFYTESYVSGKDIHSYVQNKRNNLDSQVLPRNRSSLKKNRKLSSFNISREQFDRQIHINCEPVSSKTLSTDSDIQLYNWLSPIL